MRENMAENKIRNVKARLRVIAVGRMKPTIRNEIPATIMECSLQLCGMIGLADPPRESVKQGY